MTQSRQYYSLLTSSSMMMAMIAIDWGTLASKSVVDGFIMSGNINHYKDHNINKNNNYHTKRTYQNYLHHNPTSFTYTSRIKSLQPIRSPQFSQSSSSSSSSSLFLATNTNNNEFNNNNNNMEDDSSSSSTIKKNNNNVETSRREVFEKAAGIALALTILDTTTSTMTNNVKAASAITTTLTADNEMISATSPSSNKATSQPRIIVMTGANSGIGYEACKRIMKQQQEGDDTQPKTTIVLACRTYEKAKDTMERLLNENNNNNNNIQFIPAECNLASLKSIQQFAKTYFTKPTTEDTSYPSHIDVLALNAGIARNINSEECIRTDDGYELTIGTNHFGHFYLTYLLLPFLQQKDKSNMNQKKIVITASSVHDPDSPGGSQGEKATLGTLNGLIKQGVNCEMIDGNPFNADKAYKDSKLCNVFFTRELQRRLNAATTKDNNMNHISVNCFTPGLIVSTGLFRDQNPIFTKLFDIAATSIFKVGETPTFGGTALSYMINDVTTDGLFYGCPPGTSSKYNTDQTFYNTNPIFHPTEVSIEAQDNDKAKLLWELSEKLLNIKMMI